MITDAGFEILESKVYNPKSGQHGIMARKATPGGGAADGS